MSDKKKRVFVKPELIKFDKPLNEVTLCGSGTGNCNSDGGWPEWLGTRPW
jgi:hypothetical protein